MGEKMSKISIVVPMYNEQESLGILYKELNRVTDTLPEYEFEYLFVNDGSSDATLAEIRQLAEKDKRVRYVSFSRNFGKEAALYAGLKNATGDYVATMDADLQDPPALLPQMIAMIEAADCDNVATRRVNRKGEPPIRSFFAKCFYKVMRHLSHIEIADGARDYRLMSRAMVDSIVSVSEYNRFSKGILRSITAFLRGCLRGSDMRQSGWSLRMWSGLQEKQSGVSGSWCAIRLTESLIFPIPRSGFLPISDCCSPCCRLLRL